MPEDFHKEDPKYSNELLATIKNATEVKGYTAGQLAKLLGYSEAEIQKKLNQMEKKGNVESYQFDNEKVYELTLNGLINNAIRNAPKIEGYTIKRMNDIKEPNWLTNKWHLEELEISRYPDFEIGMAKVYRLKKKQKNN